MLMQIRSLEAANNMKIIATHIPGKLNRVADTLSRVILQDNLRVNPYYLDIVGRAFTPITIDRFATACNAVHKHFNSYLLEEGCQGIDAFA